MKSASAGSVSRDGGKMSDLIDHLLAKNTSVPTVIQRAQASLFKPAPDVPWMPPSQNGGPAEHVEDDAVSIARAAARTYEEPQIKQQRFPQAGRMILPPLPLSNTAGYQEVEQTVLPPAIRGIPASSKVNSTRMKASPDRGESIAEITTSSSVQRNIHEQPQGQLQKLPGMRISADWHEEVPFPSSSTMMPDELEETARPVAQRFHRHRKGNATCFTTNIKCRQQIHPHPKIYHSTVRIIRPLTGRKTDGTHSTNSSVEAPSRLSTSPYPVQPAGSKSPELKTAKPAVAQSRQRKSIPQPALGQPTGTAIALHSSEEQLQLISVSQEGETSSGDGMGRGNPFIQVNPVRQHLSEPWKSSETLIPIDVGAKAKVSPVNMPFPPSAYSHASQQESAPTIQVTIGRVECVRFQPSLFPKNRLPGNRRRACRIICSSEMEGRR